MWYRAGLVIEAKMVKFSTEEIETLTVGTQELLTFVPGKFFCL